MKTEMYRIVFSNDAKKDLKELSKKAPQAVKKLSKLLEEIQKHPRTGTGFSFFFHGLPFLKILLYN